MNKPVRVGLVGAGAIAGAHVEAAARLSEVVVTAIADPRRDAAEAMAARAKGKAFTSHADPDFASRTDLAIIATPPALHAAIALELIGAGVGVMVEKPFTLSPDEARQVVEAAAERGVPAVMASKFRYSADVQATRGLIESGRLGHIEATEVTFSGVLDPTGTWRADPAQAGGGVIADNGPHVADLVRYLLGPVDAVRATAPSADRRERSASLELRCGEVTARAALSWDERLGDPYLRVVGTEAGLELDWPGGRIIGQGGGRPFGAGYDKLAALGANLMDVARSLREGRPPQATGLDAVGSVDVLTGLYASLRDGRWVELLSPVGSQP
ncbi:MAG TPA: Gfo/Idh/MocA family oxidoreductase [Acidimicrobiia bacterium]